LIQDNAADADLCSFSRTEPRPHPAAAAIRKRGHAMKLLDILAKLGILRYGTKAAVYRSARDRPIEFMGQGVYDAERDLTTLDDVKQAFGRKTEDKPQPPPH
jgi:hypothetical protein